MASHDRPFLAPPLLEVQVPRHPLSRLEPLIGHDRFEELERAVSVAREQLRGKTVWNINSTAAGGGVAEMLLVLVGYMLDADVDVRWLVINGDEEFFTITKRIHNRLHGVEGDDGDLGQSEAAHYSDISLANASRATEHVRPDDIVLLHDPQTAGMAAPLAGAGARVVWRSHIGCETSNEWTDQAWSFLRDHLAACSAYVFSVAVLCTDLGRRFPSLCHSPLHRPVLAEEPGDGQRRSSAHASMRRSAAGP